MGLETGWAGSRSKALIKYAVERGCSVYEKKAAKTDSRYLKIFAPNGDMVLVRIGGHEDVHERAKYTIDLEHDQGEEVHAWIDERTRKEA